MKPHALPTLAFAAILLAPVPALAAFSCPAADPNATVDRSVLSSDDMAGTAVSDKLKSLIHDRLAKGVHGGAIVDSLVAADCGRIEAETNISDQAKADQVRRFASKIANFVYTTPGKSEEDIVLNVSIPTGVHERLRQAADKAHISEDAWVNEAISAKLGKP